MLVHPLCCNDDRVGEIGPTFHFMTRHDLVLANDKQGELMARQGDPKALVQWLLILPRELGELVRRCHRNNLGLFAKP
jgi:hypothetical protein